MLQPTVSLGASHRPTVTLKFAAPAAKTIAALESVVPAPAAPLDRTLDASSAANVSAPAAAAERVSVVIPCYPPHVVHLHESIKSLARQTSPPDEILVALSGTSDADAAALERTLQTAFAHVPLRVLATTLVQTAGQNRNRGARHARHEILVFFDADDIAAPQKIAVTRRVFREHRPAMMLHRFQYTDQFEQQQQHDLDSLRVISAEQVYACSTGGEPTYFIYATRVSDNQWHDDSPTHGHATVARHVLDEVQYGDEQRGEDVLFCTRVLRRYRNTVYVDAALIQYRRHLGSSSN